MDRRGVGRLAAVVVLAGAGLVALAASSTATVHPQVGPAVTGPFVYVDANHCGPGGTGSHDAPLCTIAAAAAVVNPGQTVQVAAGTYNEAVPITRSGANGAPVTFQAVRSELGVVRVGSVTTSVVGPVFDLAQVHDVVVRGFDVSGPIAVDSSSGITIDEVDVSTVRSDGVQITGASSGVTVSRSMFGGRAAAAVEVGAGASGVVVSGNEMAQPQRGVVVTDAPGTTVTGNTVVSDCGTGITVAGTSTGVTIENNIVETAHNAPAQPSACSKPDTGVGVSVEASSTAQSVTAYNLIDPASAAPLYVWAGTAYTDLAAFSTATGQGAHDIAANPALGQQVGDFYPLTASSPAVDSGDAAAPGEAPTDVLDEPRADDPSVTNSGTGIGYVDRGANELQGPLNGGTIGLARTSGGGPFDTTGTALGVSPWTTNGPVGTVAYHFDDDPDFVVDASTGTTGHTYRTAGRHCVSAFISFSNFHFSGGDGATVCTVLGADYTPVTPVRVLDTRSAVGVGGTTPVPPGGEVVLPISAIGAVGAADISAVVLNVTVTEPAGVGFVTVYPDGGSRPVASNLNFVAHQTVPNLVTVPLLDGKLRFFNGSGGTVHLVADLEGFYGATGNGFKPQSPVRVLDTRDAGAPLPPQGDRQLDLSGKVPAGAAAAVLNVTVTAPTQAGFLTVFPSGQSLPVVSNLNFTPGQTVPNLVIVPLVNGKLSIHNGSGGTVHVVADLAGYFGTAATGATQMFVPFGPVRVADTRSVGPVRSLDTIQVGGVVIGNVASVPPTTGFVFNITVTQPTATGFLTAFPNGDPRPLASNLNFTAGQTVPNLAMVPAQSLTALFNGSPGTVQVVVDEEGYFIGPA